MDTKIPVVGISQGDINGIGYEVILKTLADPLLYDLCTPVVYGSSKVAAYHRKILNVSNCNFNNARSVNEIILRKPNIINCLTDDIMVDMGKSSRESGQAAFASLEMAVNDILSSKLDVLVTAPIDKNVTQSDSFHFNGHTEYLQDRAGTEEVLMFLVSNTLRVGLVTNHIPIRDVSSAITIEGILKKLRIMNRSLKIDFNISRPRIAVFGLNPHAGDNSLLGTEERDIIIPALKQAEKENILAFGPFSADGFFGAGLFRKFDAILAMYHDQGLAAFKSLSFEDGVNFTAGLPFVRTSPGHGTAFNIAGRGEASEQSFRSALFLGCDIFRNRQRYLQISANPLEVQEIMG